jgi:hypothetical protein
MKFRIAFFSLAAVVLLQFLVIIVMRKRHREDVRRQGMESSTREEEQRRHYKTEIIRIEEGPLKRAEEEVERLDRVAEAWRSRCEDAEIRADKKEGEARILEEMLAGEKLEEERRGREDGEWVRELESERNALRIEKVEPAKAKAILEAVKRIGENLPQTELKRHLLRLREFGKDAEPFLLEALRDENPRRRSNAVFALGASKEKDLEHYLLPLLNDPLVPVRIEAAAVLAERGCARGIPVLISGLENENEFIRENCIRVLRKETRMYFGYKATMPEDWRAFRVTKWKAWWVDQGRSLLAKEGK